MTEDKKPDETVGWKKIRLPSDCSRYQKTGGKFPDVLDEVSCGKRIPWGTRIEIGRPVFLRFGGNLQKFFPYRTEQGEEGFISSEIIPSEI